MNRCCIQVWPGRKDCHLSLQTCDSWRLLWPFTNFLIKTPVSYATGVTSFSGKHLVVSCSSRSRQTTEYLHYVLNFLFILVTRDEDNLWRIWGFDISCDVNINSTGVNTKHYSYNNIPLPSFLSLLYLTIFDFLLRRLFDLQLVDWTTLTAMLKYNTVS